RRPWYSLTSGYYRGRLGNSTLPLWAGFKLVDAKPGAEVYPGTLKRRPDYGYKYAPLPYQKVFEADFSSFTNAGEYRLVVPGLGASLPFLVDEGVAMAFARTYALRSEEHTLNSSHQIISYAVF